MRFDPEKTLLNIRRATTDDLLDRVTAFREGMELEALEMIDAELRSRGVTLEQIAEHDRQVRDALRRPDGSAAKCSFCPRPAVAKGWGWHRLWGLMPVFPRIFRYCETHRPKS